jgi:hypothetical protein
MLLSPKISKKNEAIINLGQCIRVYFFWLLSKLYYKNETIRSIGRPESIKSKYALLVIIVVAAVILSFISYQNFTTKAILYFPQEYRYCIL